MKSLRRLVGASLGLSAVVFALPLSADPVGGTVVQGSARFDRPGPGQLNIFQGTDRAIINWRDFSIAHGETTRFIQPSASSIALNRVTGGNVSRIYGNLEANGKVYLINPNGILVGRGGAVNTRGFVATTLDVSDAGFMSRAKLSLSGDSSASVVNEGNIEAIGGDVFLIARTVENSGTIRAASGTVGLATGNEVVIVPTGKERISVIAGTANGSQTEKGVNNSGTIEAVSAELKAAGGNIYALAINNGGIIRATGVRHEGGRVVLSSDGGNVGNSGTISANNANGSGGFVSLAGGHNEASPSTVINSGVINARGGTAGSTGGEVRLTGDYVGLFGASMIDVSGAAGGGTALVGGDYQGENSSVQNAQATFMSAESRVRADALARGNGGSVVMFAEGAARIYGGISARGGSAGGNGGSVETSGKGYLEVASTPDVSAAAGRGGSWLIDPNNLTIVAGGGNVNVNTTSPFDTTDDGATLGVDLITTALTGGASVIVRTGSGGANGQPGNITLNADLDYNGTGNGTLELSAHNDVIINNQISDSTPGGDSLNLILRADSDLNGSGSVTVNDPINTGGGSFQSFGVNFDSTQLGGQDGDITTAGGAATINHTGIVTLDAFLNAGAGPISITGSSIHLVDHGDITGTGAATLALSAGNGTFTKDSGAVIQMGAGTITITADTIALAGGGEIQGSGALVLRPETASRPIVLGAAGTASDFALSGTELAVLQNGFSGITIGRATDGNGALTIGGAVSFSDNVSLVGGSIALNNTLTSSGNSVALTARTGAVTDGNGAAANVVAGDLTVVAQTGIDLDTTITTLINANVAGTGNINISDTAGGLVVTSATTADGNIDITAVGALTVASAVTTAGGNITLSATGGNLDVTTATAGGSGDIQLTTTTSGDVAVGLVTAAGDAVSITSAGAVTDGNLGAVNVVSDTLTLLAAGGISLDTTITTLLSASATAAGNINIVDTAGGLIVTAASTSNGDITFTAVGGDLTVTTATAAGTGADISLTTTTSGNVNVGAVTANGDSVTITSAGAVTDGNGAAANVVAGDLTVVAQTGIDLDTTITTLINANVAGTGNINISDTAGGLVVTSATTADGNIDITAVGALTVASAVTTAGGNITLSATGGNLDVTTATAGGSGDIQLTTTTSGDVAVGLVTAAGDAVSIASAGAVTDGNGASVNVVSDTLTVLAQTGIDLDTTITTLLNASVAAAGNINLADSDSLIVTAATAANGNIGITALGALTVASAVTAAGGNITLGATGGNLDVTTATAGGSGDISLTTTTSGDVNVGAVTALGDTVTVTSAGAITDANGAAVNIVAGDLSATAVTGIDLDTTLTTLTLAQVIGAGSINISDTDGLIVTAASAANGDIGIVALGDLTVGDVTASGVGFGNITLQALGGSVLDDIAGLSDGTGITAGGVTSVTSTGGNIGTAANPLDIESPGGAVNLTANGGGVHVNTVSAGDVQFQTSAIGPQIQTTFTQGGQTFALSYADDLTVVANGNIASVIPGPAPALTPGQGSLIVPGVLTLNAVGGSIGGGIGSPLAINAGTLNARAGNGISLSEANDLTLGAISATTGPLFVKAGGSFTFNGSGSTVINANGGTAILVANGLPGVIVNGAPTMSSRFILYALNASLTSPIVIKNSFGSPTIGGLVANRLDSPLDFNPLTPDPFSDGLSHFVFSLEANPPTDPSLFIDIPVEVFQPVSIVFGDYDSTKFGDVGDLWMSSSELYDIERKAGKAPKAVPLQVGRSGYVTKGN